MSRLRILSITASLGVATLGLVLALLMPGNISAQSAVSSSFDHFTTGFDLDGAHRLADCESCHTDGIFTGTPTQCAGCHTNTGRIRAGTKPAKHPLVSQSCESCHRTSTWAPVRRMDHLEAFGQCFDCHNNRKFAGKPPNHIPATDLCEDCHNTAMWAPVARVDHFQVLGVCSGCHNGVIATGQHLQHIPTTAECDTCHNTRSWIP